MEFLNIIYFLILIGLAYQFLMSADHIVKSPLNKGDLLKLTGPEMYWVLIFSTGVLALSFDFGIDLMAIRIFVIMILCLIGFKFTACRPIWSIPIIIYGVYLIWLLIGCFYTYSFTFGIRVLLKYCYPFVFCLFASAVVDNFPTALKAGVTARWVALITVFITFLNFEQYIIPGVLWYITARVIHYISFLVFSLAMFFFTKEKKINALFFLAFLFPCFFLVLRTSILGSVVALMSFAIIKWKYKSLPVIFSVLILGVASVFYIPSLRNKMFFNNKTSIEDFREGKVDMEDVNTNYRAHLWGVLQNSLYKNHEIAGSGTGATQLFMKENPKKVAGLMACHSDFVQMKCDNGLIGISLYCLMIGAIFIHCIIIYWKTSDPRIRLFAITAGASLIGVFATCYSDNTVNYSMATLSIPFGFYGMTLALNKRLS